MTDQRPLNRIADAAESIANNATSNDVAAGDTGGSTNNGFLRWIRDFMLGSFGAKNDVMAGSDTGASSQISLTKRINYYLNQLTTNFTNYISTGNISALNQTVGIVVGNRGAVGIQVAGVNAGGVVTFYASMDNGGSYIPVNVTPFSNGGDNNPVGSASAAGQFVFVGGGFTHFQAKLTTPGAGSFDISLVATPAIRNVGVPALGSALDTVAASDTGTATLIQLVKRMLTKFTNDAGGRLQTAGRLDLRTSQMEATLQGVCWFAQAKIKATSGQAGSVQFYNAGAKTLQVSSVLAAVQTAGKVYLFLENSAKGSTGAGVIINNKAGVVASPTFEVRTVSAAPTSPLLTEGIQVTSLTTSGQGLLISGQSIVLPPGWGLRVEYANTTAQDFTVTATITEIDSTQVI